jgi:hypothetical protein
MRRRPIVLMTDPDINAMTAHNNNNTNSDSAPSEEADMRADPELYMEQVSLLPSNDGDYDDDKSKDKPAKMLSSYRGRRRLAVLAVAVAVTLGVVVVWGPLSSKASSAEDQQGTSH